MLDKKDLEMISEIVSKCVSEAVPIAIEPLERRLKDSQLALERRLKDSQLALEHRLKDSQLALERRLNESQLALERGLREVQLTLENETNAKIRIIAEGHLDLSRKLDEALKVENEKEMTLLRVTGLENEVRRLKTETGELRAALAALNIG